MKNVLATVRDALVGLILFLIVLFLVSCGPVSFDPNLAARDAQYQAERYAAMATGSAMAQVIPYTQAAVQMQMAQTQGAATTTAGVQTQQAQITQTAMSWTPTPVPTTTPNAQMTGTFSAMFAIQTQTVLETQRAERNNNARAIAWVMVGVAVMIVAILYAYAHIKRLSIMPQTVDERGRMIPFVNVLEGTVSDIERAPNGFMEMSKKYILRLPEITAQRQDRVTAASQFVDVNSRIMRRIPRAALTEISTPLLPDPTEEIQEQTYPELPLPSWVELNKWDGNLLPVGNDEQSRLLLVDPSIRPHLMYVGRSRSGKTLTGERTSAACLLTQGWNVIVMGKRVDWMPFEDHPNFRLLAVDVRKDAQKYIDILQILSAQMDVRDELLSSRHVTTWDRYGAPSTMVILDDYSGALLRMPKAKAAEVTDEVRSLAMDGAKFGLSLTIGLQDATAQNVDTTTRSQMARIVYSLDNATKSRVALGVEGAERLPPFRHFLTRITDDANVNRGVGFFLQDREVEAFLASRPVGQNGEMEWVEGVIVSPPALPRQEPPALEKKPETMKEFMASLSDEQAKILDLHIDGSSQAKIGREVYGSSGGDAYYKVADVIRRYKALNASTTSQNIPNLSTSAA